MTKLGSFYEAETEEEKYYRQMNELLVLRCEFDQRRIELERQEAQTKQISEEMDQMEKRMTSLYDDVKRVAVQAKQLSEKMDQMEK